MTRWRIRVSGSVLAAILTVVPAVQAGVNTWSGSRPGPIRGTPGVLVAMDPRDPYVVYAASPHLYKSRDGGRSWTRIATLPGISALLVHPAAPDTLYLGGQTDSDFGVVFKSSDGGGTWTLTPLPTNPWSFAGDPHDASTVFAGMDYLFSSVYKTSDGGESWSPGSTLVGTIVSLGIDSSNSAIVYAGTDKSGFPDPPSAAFARSQDGGETWSRLDPGTFERVSAIAIDPAVPSTLYIGLSATGGAERGVRRSEDGGISFARADHGLHREANVTNLVIDPANPSTLYAGTDSGIYRSRDSGSSWTAIGQILSGSAIDSLVISADGRRIHAGTPSGPFHIDLVSGPVDLAAAPGGGARILRWNGDRSAVQTVDGSNNWTSTPFSATSESWSAIAIASASDGPARALWQNGDGRSAVETVGGSVRVFSPSPYEVPADVAIGVDGTIVLLSTTVSGVMHLETLTTDGSMRPGQAYAAPGWDAVAVDVDAQGRAWVLWRSVDGRAAVSLHVDGTIVTTVKWGATEGWWVEDLGVGSDGRARVLARTTSGSMQIWTVGEDGSRSASSTYESPGLVPRRIAAGSDGLIRVLWGGDDSEGQVWFLTSSGNHVAVEVPVLP
jgi:photosystem II stability/assembly factor-like uncharacterized protein